MIEYSWGGKHWSAWLPSCCGEQSDRPHNFAQSMCMFLHLDFLLSCFFFSWEFCFWSQIHKEVKGFVPHNLAGGGMSALTLAALNWLWILSFWPAHLALCHPKAQTLSAGFQMSPFGFVEVKMWPLHLKLKPIFFCFNVGVWMYFTGSPVICGRSVLSLLFLYIQVKNSNTFTFGAVSPILTLVLLCCR